MRLVPKDTVGKIEFYEIHLPQWSDNPDGIGTTPQQVADLDTKVQAARAAYAEQQQAQQAAMVATQKLQRIVADMANAGAAIIEQVRSKARSAGPSVYPLAHIPIPATPSPKPAPGKPTGFTVELQATGALTLRWKCPNPASSSGTMYQIWRRIGTGEFAQLGWVGKRQFVDDTVPPGTSSITYQLQAARSTAVGPCAQFNVNFGVSGTAVTESQSTPIAA